MEIELAPLPPKVVVLNYEDTPWIGKEQSYPGAKAMAYARAVKSSVILYGAPTAGFVSDRGEGIHRPIFGLEMTEKYLDSGVSDPIGFIAESRKLDPKNVL